MNRSSDQISDSRGAKRAGSVGRKPDSVSALDVSTRRTLAWVLLFCVVILSAAVGWRNAKTGNPVPIRIATGLDPNTATWYELAQLPGLGESAGRAIVAYRTERARELKMPVFKSAADLEPVPGIGIATIERIRPHLRFSAAGLTTQRTSK